MQKSFLKSAGLLAVAGFGISFGSALYADPLLGNGTGISSMYVSGQLGGAWLQQQYWSGESVTATISDVATASTNYPGAQTDYNLGFNGNIAIGAKYNNFRGEFAVGYLRNKMKKLNYTIAVDDTTDLAFTRTSDGNRISAISYLVNLYYDVDTGQSWFPYFKLGLGAATFDVKSLGYNADTEATYAISKVYTRPAGQAGIGVGYKPTPSLMISLEYDKFLASRVPMALSYTNVDGEDTTVYTTTVYSAYQNNLVNLGLTYFISL